MKLGKLLQIVSLVTIVTTIGIVAVVSAQGPTERGLPFWGPRGDHSFGGRGGFMHNEELQAQKHALLAEALGMSVEELETALAEGQTLREIAGAQGVEWADIAAAMEDARRQALEQAVADGILTQEQADRISERPAMGPMGIGPHRGRGQRLGFGQNEGFRTQMHETLAGVLGLSVEDLEAALAGGQALEEIAIAQGVDLDDVEAAMQAAHRQALEQAVADGVLTQEQADLISQRSEGHPFGEGFGQGLRGKRGGFRGFSAPSGAPSGNESQ